MLGTTWTCANRNDYLLIKSREVYVSNHIEGFKQVHHLNFYFTGYKFYYLSSMGHLVSSVNFLEWEWEMGAKMWGRGSEGRGSNHSLFPNPGLHFFFKYVIFFH